jgi:hypothetical protein
MIEWNIDRHIIVVHTHIVKTTVPSLWLEQSKQEICELVVKLL